MRTALTALLAFATGVLLMLLLSGHAPLRSVVTAPAVAGSAADNTSDNVANASSSGDDANDNWPNQGPTPEQVIYSQPQRVRDALAHLSPRVANKPNLYLLAFAGDGGEDVFHNEAEYAAQLFTQRFGPSTHALVLENNPDTLQTHPLADWSNLEDTLTGLSKVMKPEDILVLYMTSHGDESHDLLVDMDPLPLDQIGAPDLADIFKKHPFKWKVVVVNACYSGGFVPDLRGPDTLVLTAARSDRSSFGCGSDSDITYFGHAWLVDALNRTPDFIEAFKLASNEISQWEQQDKLTPSVPQIDVGSGISGQLALWQMGFTPGPAVAFKPTAPASARSVASPH